MASRRVKVFTPPKAPVKFTLPGSGQPDLVRAASLALGVLGYVKVPTWAEFLDRVAAGDREVLYRFGHIAIRESDFALLETHEPVLRRLSVTPNVSVAVCPHCQNWVLISGAASASARCTAGEACPVADSKTADGMSMVKASRAVKAKF